MKTITREPAGRVQRRADRGRKRRGRVLVAILIVACVAVLTWVEVGHRPSSAAKPSAAPVVPEGKSKFLAVSVTGAVQPLMAVVGTNGLGKSTALPIPMQLTMVVPGAGEMQAKDVGHLPGPVIDLALSNLVGAWADHYVVIDLNQLAALIDKTGGLNANLQQPFVLDSGAIGPGKVTLDGAQVRALLSTPDAQAQAAWGMVLGALLAHPPTLAPSDVAASDDLAAVQTSLRKAAGAEVGAIPIATVAGTTTVAAQPGLDQLMTATFGVRTAVPVIVQNGSGEAGIGGALAQKILPAGFRVVISGNAPTFDHSTTLIIANGIDNVSVARRLRSMLGIGSVRLSRVPSGVAQITVVVGKDFKA
jgi:hypothetical protein